MNTTLSCNVTLGKQMFLSMLRVESIYCVYDDGGRTGSDRIV